MIKDKEKSENQLYLNETFEIMSLLITTGFSNFVGIRESFTDNDRNALIGIMWKELYVALPCSSKYIFYKMP